MHQLFHLKLRKFKLSRCFRFLSISLSLWHVSCMSIKKSKIVKTENSKAGINSSLNRVWRWTVDKLCQHEGCVMYILDGFGLVYDWGVWSIFQEKGQYKSQWKGPTTGRIHHQKTGMYWTKLIYSRCCLSYFLDPYFGLQWSLFCPLPKHISSIMSL